MSGLRVRFPLLPPLISDDLLREMKKFYECGNSYKETANKFGFSKLTIIDNFKRRLNK